jgi:threonine dehydratase
MAPPPTLRDALRPTTVIDAPRLSKSLGMEVVLVSETFQLTGSFKFRAAFNVAMNIPNERVITASSGNFGQAMALACSMLGKGCTVVMPQTSAKTKIDAVREYGGRVDLIDVAQVQRSERVAELAATDPEAYVASAYDDPLVIGGNASLGQEIHELRLRCDAVLAPVGGGGLTAGLVQGLREKGGQVEVWGAEPLMANDAARSLRSGELVRNESEPQTLADGARTVSLGNHNWAILAQGLREIVEVPEEAIAEGVRLLFALANLKCEPTGALSIGALLTAPHLFRDKRICCVISGGNVDPSLYAQLLDGS